MKLDLPVAEVWENLNDSIKSLLAIPEPLQLRCYKDLSSAVLEIAQGTAQFLSHKKSLGFVRGQTPAFDFLLPHFYKEAFQIKHTPYFELQDLKIWVEALNKDTSFVIFAEDHPVTGETYAFCDQLDQLLNEKRIHSIRISHARFLKSDLPVRPYSVQICSWAEDLTIAICGERFRSPPMVAPRQNWKPEFILRQLKDLQTSAVEAKNEILDFEKRMAMLPHVNVWFTSDQARLWDRAVLNFTDVSGEALAQQIFKKMGASPSSGWAQIETTNLCRWNTTRLYQNWWEPLPANDVLRGLMIFDAAVLGIKDFESLLLSSYEEVKSLQTW